MARLGRIVQLSGDGGSTYVSTWCRYTDDEAEPVIETGGVRLGGYRTFEFRHTEALEDEADPVSNLQITDDVGNAWRPLTIRQLTRRRRKYVQVRATRMA